MILYHGTNVHFNDINLKKSNNNKDFGKGFYLSEDLKQAEVMASFKVSLLGGDIVINSYEVADDILEDQELNVKVFGEYSEEWAKFVFENRSSGTGVHSHSYDIVYGPIADDRVGLQIRKLQDGLIDFDEFMRKVKYMKGITFQYFFATEKAISKLKRL